MDRVQVSIGLIRDIDRRKLDLSKYEEAVCYASSQGEKLKGFDIVRLFGLARAKLRQICSKEGKKYIISPNGTAMTKRIRFSNCQCGYIPEDSEKNWCLYIVEGSLAEEKMTLLVRKCDLYICAFINDIVCEGSGNVEKMWMVLSENRGPIIEIADHANWAHFPISISYGSDGDESAYEMGCKCLLNSICKLNRPFRFRWNGTHNCQVAEIGNDTERYRLAKALRSVCHIVAETTRFTHIRELMTKALIETMRNMQESVNERRINLEIHSSKTLDLSMRDDIRDWVQISGRVRTSDAHNADPADVLKLYTARGLHQGPPVL